MSVTIGARTLTGREISYPWNLKVLGGLVARDKAKNKGRCQAS